MQGSEREPTFSDSFESLAYLGRNDHKSDIEDILNVGEVRSNAEKKSEHIL